MFDTRRNQRLAKNTGGTITSTPSASCHDSDEHEDDRADEQEDVLHEQHEALRDRAPASRRCRRSCGRRSGRSSRSRSSRATAPSCARTSRLRRSRRKPSPMRATRTIASRPSTSPTNASTRYDDHREVRARRRRRASLGSPSSMPYFTSSGPGEQRGRLQPSARASRPRSRARCGPQHAQQPAEDLARLVARQRLLGNVVAPEPAH